MRAVEVTPVAGPFLLVQLSDPHIGATWADGDPVAGLRAAVAAVGALRPQPNAVLVTGDLADNASDDEYEQVKELLAPLRAPVHALPGNHDDRRAMHRHFGIPGADGEPAHHAVDLGPLRLISLDTTVPGEDGGSIDAACLRWLAAELARAPDAPTLLAMHHPPVRTGVSAWDEIGVPEADRRALGEVLEHHPQVQRVVAGHVHRAVTAQLGRTTVLTVPSTYVQGRLDFLTDELQLAQDPPAFAVHAVLDGAIVSHLQPVLVS